MEKIKCINDCYLVSKGRETNDLLYTNGLSYDVDPEDGCIKDNHGHFRLWSTKDRKQKYFETNLPNRQGN